MHEFDLRLAWNDKYPNDELFSRKHQLLIRLGAHLNLIFRAHGMSQAGGHKKVLSSQLLLSKAEILSVLDLRNSKSWWTRNLDIMNCPRPPPNSRLGSQGHILQLFAY